MGLSVLVHLLIPELNSPKLDVLIEGMANSLIYLFLYMVIILLLQTTIFYRINAIITQSDRGNFEALLQAIKKLLPIILATWLYTLLVILGLTVLIPGLILAVSLRFFTPLILFENATVFKALQRSHQLVWGNWWQTATILMVPLLVSMFFSVIASAIIEVSFEATLAQEQVHLIMQLAYLVVEKLFNPFFYTIVLLQYYDLKQRNKHLEQRDKYFVA